MARPRSEDKQQALLHSATEVIATQGLVASTASIAKLAGVAEGTLFRYFATKDILLAAVFDYLIVELEECLARNSDSSVSIKHRTQIMWDNYIDWGIANPAAYATMNQLAVSGKLAPEQLDKAMKLCGDVGVKLEAVSIEGLSLAQSTEFIDSVLTAIANTTVALASAHPDLITAYKKAGFAVMWKAITPDS
jgi:AcrR family transcriptional regulator